MKRLRACALVFYSIAAASGAQAACYDISKGQPSQLSGELYRRILPGPPNYKDVQTGDQPEPTYLLELDADICLQGEDFADPESSFREVHVVPVGGMDSAVASLIGRRVTVGIVDRWAADNAHHRAPLMAIVGSIAPEEDITEQYGTPATVVRAFYLALGTGDGKEAARFVVPGKSAKGPLSAAALSGFYGGMQEPLKLLGIEAKADDLFFVSYAFRKGATACSGRAEVTTVNEGGKDYIEGIKALDGC
ncbi:hypothetical protein EN745_00310 [Mesorhizobium sp. M4A.F.Ca.ET.022.05.2.1]|uniref:hypothetical protein n=1 Tax=Mesorhizobium sp. M4A.F.Ca.ET.022.05.2.1 TaxID=2496653 RepID=UPI000FD1C45C|nr:hypothetical protein [Mesorhizobium sp. M4A.F.Ca.ET.022.05.2.1]RVC84025.1 hypothetical protein EN745_00310 [Mesorhizobium sp. M4A.F.Ca.ET.022.05.2.1]